MHQRTVERLATVSSACVGLQTAIRVIESDVAVSLRNGALCCLAVGALGVVLAGFDAGLDRLPGRPSRSQVGGISTIGLGLGWLAVPIAGVFSESPGLYNAALIACGVLFLWIGVRMFRGHEEYRLAEPGEDLQAKRAEQGRNASIGRVVRDEALRFIGTFGLLTLPTGVVVVASSGLKLTDLWVYVPAAVITVVIAAFIVQLRRRTGAGPQLGQIHRAARRHG
jgi:threonine/homoserine/homoserine lactone efflux protein